MEEETTKVIGISCVFILGVLILVTLMLTQRAEMAIEFDINNIEYVPMPEGTSCWMGFSPDFCPVPTDIHIKMKGDIPLSLIPAFS